MSRFCWPVVFAIALFCRPSVADDAPKFKNVILPDAVHYAQLFSADSRVGTMIFDNFVVATESGKASLPSVATKKFTYVLFPDSTTDVCVRTLIRGFVSTNGSGSASLLIHAGGKSHLIDLPKAIAEAKAGTQTPKGEHHQRALKAARDQGMKVGRAPQQLGDDFLHVLCIRVPVGKPLQVTCNLLVDRLTGDDNSGALLTIDSIDFEATPADAGKK